MNDKDSGRREDVTSEKEKRLTVALYLDLCLLHLLEQFGIANYTRSIPHFSTCLIQTSDDAYKRPFRNVCQFSDLLEGLMGKRLF